MLLCLPLHKGGVSAQYIGNYFALDIFPAFINLSNHLYNYGFMDIYFLLWAINQCYFIYFIAHIALALAIGRSFCTPLSYSNHFFFFFFLAFSYFLAVQHTTDWTCIFPALVLVSHISKEPLFFFIGEWCQQPYLMIWVLDVFIALQVLLFS